ncbi:peptide antibiotic transporter SbmA [Oceanomicrobium pacificus]|uniref:Peptide antibiotic transporter SbmA n=1 Tax=Oceanomicrobium pacificus TaxID=2692916 RepID=A0A6B0TRP9_9RHOB|nr:peptide antibiotic transporter SbmA [Oceanomicrobium pacificus]MXU64034.1 peptide antibiotic transporter SbmA [Oceanomicrobium pacificus]
MFHSFFPKPKLFFGSFVLWGIGCVLLWFLGATHWGETFSLGPLVGFDFPAALGEDATEEAQAAFAAAAESAQNFWFYQYMLVCYALFVGFWMIWSPHKWGRWSVFGSAVILFINWFMVQLDVLINEWFGDFYDYIQIALSGDETYSLAYHNGLLLTFLKIAMTWMLIAVFNAFLVSHYVFRWRTAMNDYYTSVWPRVRHVEGASQRIQEDTMRFAGTVERLGISIIDSFLVLIAFIPILWELSAYVTRIPIFGEVPQPLVFTAIMWSVIGTAIVAAAGIRLPGLEFRNQRVEAAYRKELVLGEDYEDRAQPPTLAELFGNVRRNYFRLYLNYLYFNIFRYSYLQMGALVPYFALGPTIVSAGFTFGVMQQILRAFGRVENSFQFLINSWPTIVELMSIYKRLAAFEAVIDGDRLSDIEYEVKQAGITE